MSDVTKWMTIRAAGALVIVMALAVTLSLTVLRPAAAPATTPSVPAGLGAQVPGAVLPVEAGDVLPPLGTQSPVPSVTGLARVLRPLFISDALGPAVSIDILDPLTGEHLLTKNQTIGRTPASTAKLLTSAAALTALGPQTTLATTVVTAPGQSNQTGQPEPVVLVGGGDVLLAKGKGDPDAVNGRAGLSTLADRTATALRAQGRSSVRLTLDDTLFTGPSRAPGWAKTDVSDGYVAPMYPLEINDGRLTGADYAPRSNDPAMAVAKVFAGLLAKRGVKVSGMIRRGPAPANAAVLGKIESAPISGLVEYALTNSDNTVAEMLGRLVAAKAGVPAGFAEVGPQVLAVDRKLGVPVTGALLLDGSGLSGASKVPPLALTEVLALATQPDHPQLQAILSGMPIADVSGTLVNRFTEPGQRDAAGVVRAKTGTLTGVSSLAGMVVDADGRLLVFAAMADRNKSTTAARNALDKLATTLAACGCR